MTYHHFLVYSPKQLATFCPSFSHLSFFCIFIQQGQKLKIAELSQQLNTLSHHEYQSVSCLGQSRRFHHLPLYIDLSRCNFYEWKLDFFGAREVQFEVSIFQYFDYLFLAFSCI